LKILITGSRGFIGKNLYTRLNEMVEHSVITYNRGDDPESLTYLIEQCDAIVHLAGEMRPSDNNELFTANVGLTEKICSIIKNSTNKKILLLASSIQADQDNAYGLSKLQAEQAVVKLSNQTGTQVIIYRLPHVFGRWGKPNYNSVIATFCHNISRGIPIKINDPDAIIKPVYIDDVVSEFLKTISCPKNGISWGKVSPQYEITIGELANRIKGFKKLRGILKSYRSGVDLNSALYLTYMSHLESDSF
jgi:UDP-2-acetamido-2,6-beta-L-arabino-hexul-4-ose reductase